MCSGKYNNVDRYYTTNSEFLNSIWKDNFAIKFKKKK